MFNCDIVDAIPIGINLIANKLEPIPKKGPKNEPSNIYLSATFSLKALNTFFHFLERVMKRKKPIIAAIIRISTAEKAS